MTTYKSDAVNLGLMPDFAKAGTIIRAKGTYETPAAAALAPADVIQMVPIPANSEILVVNVRIDKAFSSAGAQVTVGDGGDTDRFFAALLLKTAGDNTWASKASANTAGLGKVYSTADTIDLVALSALSTGVIITMSVFYQMTDAQVV